MQKSTNYGIPADYKVQPLGPNDAAEDRSTCGTCGLSWDDGKVTSMTPAPSGRCPFESFHSQDDEEEDSLLPMSEFLTNHDITMRYKQVSSNPNRENQTKEDTAWDREASHWKCFFSRGLTGRTFVTHFSMGSGLKGEPEAGDVLDCIASDCRGLEQDATGAFRPFEQWASEYGYDPDSRAAERTYHIIIEQSARLVLFLGRDLYNVLLNDVEPL